ncbi:hypothetical protein EJB05_23252 [Eragrostis curvula]|uniref:C2H2-type domain-containing protein n=1 Tax=Eragrostis curvula TaxID=38414 RepID=A0A5J9V6J1_9POAL|nr:hypothetical protein EJB05_23252 [Eragrostis curvula]
MEGLDECLNIRPLATAPPSQSFMNTGEDDKQHDGQSKECPSEEVQRPQPSHQRRKMAAQRKRPQGHNNGVSPQPPNKRRLLECSVCDVSCMTTFHLEQHMKGKKHKHKQACHTS